MCCFLFVLCVWRVWVYLFYCVFVSSATLCLCLLCSCVLCGVVCCLLHVLSVELCFCRVVGVLLVVVAIIGVCVCVCV